MTDTAALSTDDRVVLSRFAREADRRDDDIPASLVAARAAPLVETDDAEAATRYVARFRDQRVPSWARETPAAIAEVSA